MKIVVLSIASLLIYCEFMLTDLAILEKTRFKIYIFMGWPPLIFIIHNFYLE